MSTMQLLDRIEKRRFVGREFLMWLWFESELFDATLSTAAHGEFGLWIEGAFVLSAGKEATRIKGSQPASAREAKESVLRGKLPESAGLHLSWGEREMSFSIKAETLAIARLGLPTALDKADETPLLLDDDKKAPPKKKRTSADRERSDADEEKSVRFAERMELAGEFEGLVETLYRDFLRLRLGPAWDQTVLPAINSWILGGEVDGDAYAKARKRAL